MPPQAITGGGIAKLKGAVIRTIESRRLFFAPERVCIEKG
jgi:hypothetical protein